jgi:hypothetical protein
MSDLRDKEQEEELMHYWQECATADPDSAQLIKELLAKVTRFDRTIFWRNFREYAAGLVVLIWAGYYALKGHKPSMAMVLGVAFVMTYLWWQHRKLKPLDPSANAIFYRKALVERFDDQIRLLSRVKYWYLLPLYLPIVWMSVERWPRYRWAAVVSLVIVTAAYGFIGWLNEKCAVRYLQKARANVKAMFEEEQS